MQGRLILVPSPLDFGCDTSAPLGESLPAATIYAAATIGHWICENAKTARAFLKRVDAEIKLRLPVQELNLQELPRAVHKHGDHVGAFDARPLLAPALQGHDIGLLSEAGMPAIADPGASVVRAAHAMGLRVQPLVGPVSLLLALAASGLNGQNFAFVGYLPQDAAARAHRIRELETLARRTGQTQMLIETPYRNTALLHALLEHLRAETRLSVASGLMLAQAAIRSEPVSAWRKNRPAEFSRLPAVFAFGP